MSSDSKHIKWLHSRLPELVEKGVLSDDCARKMREHFGEPGEGVSVAKAATIAFSSIGAVLVAGGVILLVAFNWDDFPHNTRVALAFLPLALTTVVAFLASTRYSESAAWRECAAIFQSGAVAAAIALVSQIYQIHGNLSDYLFVCLLLSFPLTYIFKSNVLGVVYILGMVFWTQTSYHEKGSVLLFWPLLALVVPWIVTVFRRGLLSTSAVFTGWALVALLLFSIIPLIGKDADKQEMLIFACLLSGLYLTGRLAHEEDAGFWKKPFHSAGVVGIVLLSYYLSSNIDSHHISPRLPFGALIPSYVLLAAAAIPLALCAMRKKYDALAMGSCGLLMFLCLVWRPDSQVLFSFYILGIGALTIIKGAGKKCLGLVNMGMLLIAALIIQRFAVSDMNLAMKGLGFILSGVMFFLGNILFLSRNKKELGAAK